MVCDEQRKYSCNTHPHSVTAALYSAAVQCKRCPPPNAAPAQALPQKRAARLFPAALPQSVSLRALEWTLTATTNSCLA